MIIVVVLFVDICVLCICVHMTLYCCFELQHTAFSKSSNSSSQIYSIKSCFRRTALRNLTIFCVSVLFRQWVYYCGLLPSSSLLGDR